MTVPFLQDMAVVMIVAGLVTLIFRRLKQPVVLGYLVAGLIVGPYTPPNILVSDAGTIRILAEMGIVFLMFSLGLEFSLRKLRVVGMRAFVIAAFEILFMVWVGYQIGYVLGWKPMDCLFLGVMISLTSTTIVVKSLRDSGTLDHPHGRLISGVAIFDDIFVIIVMVLLPALGGQGPLPTGELALHLLKLFVFLVAAVVVGLLVAPKLMRYVGGYKSDEMTLIMALALCFGVAVLTAQMGYSMALGAFLIGAILAETRELGRILDLTAPLRDMFSAIFFVAIGMMIDPRDIVTYAGPVALIVVVYVLAKVYSCTLGGILAGVDARTSLRIGTGMAQIGEFAFILATLGAGMGILGEQLHPIIVAVAAVNALVRPYLVGYTDRLADHLKAWMPGAVRDTVRVYSQWVGQIGSGRERPIAGRLVRSLVWQIVLNVALIAAAFLVATFLAATIGRRFDATFALVGGGNTVFWFAAAVLALPLYIATVRKMEALAMMLADLAVPSGASKSSAILRPLLRHVMFGGLVLGLAMLTLVLSLGLLPGLLAFLALALVITFLVVRYGTSFNAWYTRAKFTLVDVWNQPPPAPSVPNRPLPAQLQSVDIETYTLTQTPPSGWLIRELGLRAITGASIVALERNGATLVNPGPDEELQPGDRVLLLGDAAQLAQARRWMESPVRQHPAG